MHRPICRDRPPVLLMGVTGGTLRYDAITFPYSRNGNDCLASSAWLRRSRDDVRMMSATRENRPYSGRSPLAIEAGALIVPGNCQGQHQERNSVASTSSERCWLREALPH